jgi:predicted AlkP superfamily pyrophosphatase or phosphodiesterase
MRNGSRKAITQTSGISPKARLGASARLAVTDKKRNVVNSILVALLSGGDSNQNGASADQIARRRLSRLSRLSSVFDCSLRARYNLGMNSRLRRVVRWFLGLGLFFPFAVAASTNHHVILITIDGAAGYYLSDSNASLPTLRRLASEGAMAEGMRVSNPAITWPNHTTLVTGVHPEKHSVLFNGVLVRPGPGLAVRVDGARDRAELVAVPTLYDHLHRAGYRTAEINWPCTRQAKTLDDSFPDVPDQLSWMTPRLRDELIALRLLESTNDLAFRNRSAAVRDQIWTAAAGHVLRQRRPNFLLIHMLVTDSIQHKYGPQSPAAYTALALADAHVGEILRAVNDAGLTERTTIILTADHGFESARKIIHPNIAFRKSGLLDVAATPTLLQARAQIISEGGMAMVYFTDPDRLPADRERVLELMRHHEGIAEILAPDQFRALGLPDPAKNRQMADLILVATNGYAFSNEARGEDSVTEVTLSAGNQGHHGFLSRLPKMNALFVAWGRGIKPGTRLGVIDNIDVAPTVALLLGHSFPGMDGRVLTQMLLPGSAGK